VSVSWPGNQLIWIAVASIVCGVTIVSLLNGSGLPWILIVVVVVLGLATSIGQHRRHRRKALRLLHLSDQHDRASALKDRSSPPDEALAPGESDARRAGVRSRSLGGPSQGTADDAVSDDRIIR
jgi:membrane protein implicated in regulation of membrane protease activity